MSSLVPWLSLVLVAAAPAKSPSADVVLREVAQVYGTMTSYHFEGAIRMTVKPQGHDEQTMDMPFVLAAAPEGRVHTEMTNPMLGLVNVSNGQQSWLYVPRLGQYTQTQSAPIADRGGHEGGVQALTAGTPLTNFLNVERGLKSARILREEPLRVDGKSVDCYVIEAAYEAGQVGMKRSPKTMWVAKKSHLVLKDDATIDLQSSPGGGPVSMRQVTTFRHAQVNQPVPDALFTFKPPSDAKKVDQIAIPGMKPPDVVGQSAADFTLPDLSGRQTSLSSWRGKVVLLDFWASWCAPCRREMPTIAKLHQELKGKGLVVVGLNVGESPAVARRFVEQGGYDFPNLLDTKGATADSYAASGLPTVVVIDTQGKISSHFVGVRSEAVLRQALKQAGLD